MGLPRRGRTDAAHTGADDREAHFERLFRDNSRPLLGYALRRTERPEDAADVVSEVMLIAWRRLEDVPAGPKARLWLFGVARRVVANQDRSAARRLRLGERLRQQVSRGPSPDHVEIHQERESVRAALGRLREVDRELVRLVFWEGLNPREAARVVGITGPAARSRLHRARRRLGRELTAMGPNDDPEPRSRSKEVPDPRLYPRTEEEA